ncbi:MAG TPA: glycoside hydrolase family 15 protein [Gemmatimonadales bacterium]|jgi:GH15 family glucan-1,4-alpha-glucosidase|nr:glycoside hydrolase family 15 protein [Gemmatimonadales bacterium]
MTPPLHSVPPLNHAAIGNGRVLGLVSPTSAMEWLCLPRFDSPSVFARLLDSEAGGVFRVLHEGKEVSGQLRYLANTNVAATRFDGNGAAWEVVDFAPRLPGPLGADRIPIEVVRLINPLGGQPRLSIDLDPRPNYARERPEWSPTTDGYELRTPTLLADVASNLPLPYLVARREFILTAPVFVSLRYGRREEPPTLASVQHDLDVTVAGWRQWAKTCALPTYAPEAVLRSALCLKLHVYHDTGAVIAAATTSIPEAMGTPRTWDYRFCWLRDAAFSVEALRRLSHLNEGERLLRFVRDVVEAGPLQPVYGIGGERDLEEITLSHLAGFGANGHVRAGNAASLQLQNDLLGEIVLCFESLLTDPRIVHDDPSSYFPLLRKLVERAIEVAPQPDTGIWEFRTRLAHHTFSRAMCWVAMHRGALLADRFGFGAEARRWEAIAERERALILEHGFNPALGFFTQTLDGEFPDASNLLLPTLGLVDAKDPRFIATVEAYERVLTLNGLMRRYCNVDDFGDTTSSFSVCAFWHAEALALMGRLEDAMALFTRLLGYANPVGLFSEDIDPTTGALLGNFPQSYTHVGLVHAAMTIGELLEARDGRVRAWT